MSELEQIRDGQRRLPPFDREAEDAVIGTMFLSRSTRDTVVDVLTADDFYVPLNRAVFQAILDVTASGDAVDRVALRSRLKEDGTTLDDATISRFMAAVPVLHDVNAEARLILRFATARRAIAMLDRALVSAWDGDPDDVRDVLMKAEEILAPDDAVVEMPIDAYDLAAEDHNVDWIVRGWLARHEIVLFVAEPGSGKTTLLNQCATCMAAGIHPWERTRDIEPLVVLVFDMQDSRGARGRSVQQMIGYAGKRLTRGRLFYELRTQGLDLTRLADQRWFEAKVAKCNADVVIAGPLYNMVSGAPGRSKHSEETAEIAGKFLAEMVVRRNCALLVEAHAPHGDELRVRGSKYWEDWAGWGIGLRSSEDENKRRIFRVERFRGDREAGRSWPTHWQQGNPEWWPWEAAGMPKDDSGGTEQIKF